MEIIGGVGIEVVADYSGLQEDLDAAQSLAASAAAKIADALDIATPDTAPVTQALQQISDAATSTGQSIATALDVQVAAPDVSPVIDSFTALAESAKATGDAVKDVFSHGIDTAGIADAINPIWEDLKKLEDEFIAAGGAVSDFSGPMGQAATAIEGVGASAIDGQAALQVIIGQLKDGEIGGKEFISMANALAQALEATGAAAAETGTGFDTGAEGEKQYSDAAQAIIDKQTAVDQALADAVTALGEIHDAFVAGAVGADTLARAEDGVEAAIRAAGSAASEGAASSRLFSDGVQSIIDVQGKLDAELENARAVLSEMQAAFNAGAVSAETLARAEAEVEAALQAANPSIKESGEDAHTASAGLEAMASAFVALGTALAVTEGLKDFGEAALKAFGEEEQVTIGLTQLSGSADMAAAAMQNLKAQANEAGISQDALLKTAQRLAAQFGEGDGLTGVLKAAENAAAATGRSVDAIAGSLERVDVAGQVNTKTLINLGLSWQDLAKQMGTSVDEAQAKLKKGGQDAAQDVQVLLDTINSKFHDAAAAQGAGLIGMFETFKNQLDDLLQDVGKAIAPAIEGLLGFFTASILPILQGVIKGFEDLPGPIQQVTIVLGLATAAIVPLAAGLGAIGLAVAAAQTAIPALTSLVESLGLSSAATAVEEEAAAVATTHLGEAAAAAAGESGFGALASGATIAEGAMTGLVGVLGVGLIAATAAAVAGFADLKAGMAGVEAQAKSTDDAFQKWIQSQVDVAIKSGNIADAQDKVKTALDNAAISADKATDLLNKLAAAQKNVTGVDWKNYASDLGIVVTNLDLTSEATQKLYDAQGKANDAVDKAKQVLEDVRADLANNQASTMDLARAEAEYEKAVKSATVETDASKQSHKDAAAAIKEHATELKNLNDVLGKDNELLGQVADSFKGYLQSVADGGKTAAAELKELDTAIANTATAASKLKDPAMIGALQEMIDKLKEARDTVKDFAAEDVWNKLAGQISELAAKFPEQIGKLTGSLKDFVAQAELTASTVPAALAKVDAAGLLGKWLEAQKQLDDQTQKLGQHFQDAANKFKEGVQNEVIPITVTLQDRLNGVDKTLQGVAANASQIWNTTAIGEYIKNVKDLNAAGITTLQQQEAQIGNLEVLLSKAQAINVPLGEQLALQSQIAQKQIEIGNETGQAADQWVLGLEKVRLKQEELALSSHGLADQYVNMITDVLKGFDQMGAAMSDAIVNGKNLGDALVGQFKKIGQSILTDIINAALIPLKLALLELIGSLLPGVNLGLTSIGGGLGAVNTSAGQAAAGLNALAQAAQTAAASINSSVSGGPGGGGGSGIGSTIGTISSVVSAGAAVASAILLGHISSDTGHIEVNTRGSLAEALNLRADAWSQYNTTYDRLGEIKNSLDSIHDQMSALISALTGIAGTGLQPSDSKALQEMGANAPQMLSELKAIDASTQYINGRVDTLHNDLQEWFPDLHDALYMINGTILTLISAINYGQQSGKSYSSQSMEASAQIVHEIQSSSTKSQASAHAITQSIDAATGASNITAEQQRQIDLAAAAAAENSALTLDARIAALQAESAAAADLMNMAARDNNAALVATYKEQSQEIQQRLLPLLSATQTVNSSVNAVNTSIINGSTDVAYSATNAGVLVSTAVGQSAVQISNAVINSAAASASLFNTGLSSLTSIIGAFGKAGGGLPGGQSGLPSGSGLGNTNPNGQGVYTLPGVNNPGVVNGPQAGFNPNAPATGGMTQAQWNATGHASTAPDWWLKGLPQPGINQGNLPHFQTGGTVEIGGLAVVDTGELVLPEGLAAAVKGGETTIGTQPTANTTGGNVLFTEPNKVDLSSADKGFVDHGESTDPDAWKQLADQVAGVGAAIAAQDKARATVADQMTVYQAEIAHAQKLLADAQQSGDKAKISLAQQYVAMMGRLIDSTVQNGPKDKTPIQDPNFQPATSDQAKQIAVLQQQANDAQAQLIAANKSGDAAKIQAAQQQVSIALAALSAAQAQKQTTDQIATLQQKIAVDQLQLIDAQSVGDATKIDIAQMALTQDKQLLLAAQSQQQSVATIAAAMGKPGIEITEVGRDLAARLATINAQLIQAQTALSVAFQSGDAQKIALAQQQVDVIRQLLAAVMAGSQGSAAQQGPSQQDLLAASMAWLDAQQGITADQKAISAATYQADAKAGLLPSPGGSGSSFSGYNPYSTPAGPQAASLPSSTPSGPANKTPLIDPTFTQPYGPANKTPVQDIPSFDVGGFIGRDMLAMVHAGEWVIPNAGKIALPPEVMARIQMPNIPGAPNVPNVPFSTGSGGGTGDSFTFIIQGITDPDLLAREISSRIKTRTGRTAKFSN